LKNEDWFQFKVIVHIYTCKIIEPTWGVLALWYSMAYRRGWSGGAWGDSPIWLTSRAECVLTPVTV